MGLLKKKHKREAPKPKDAATHEYVGPTIRYSGYQGIGKGAQVRIVGRGRMGMCRVIDSHGGRFQVPRNQLRAL
jgi:hypothetical protein